MVYCREHMEWWHWIIFGTVLLILEVAITSGFFLLFCGLSAFLVGGLFYAGVAPQVWLQWILFTVFSFVLIVLFRQKMFSMFSASPSGGAFKDDFEGEIAIAQTPFVPNGQGNVECRGSTWQGKNVSSEDIQPGQRCKVRRAEGLVLWVVPDKG